MAAAVVKALDTKAPFKAVTLKYKAKKYLGVSDFPELRGEVGLLVLSSSFLLSPSPPLILFSPLPELRGEVGPLFSSSSLLLFTPLAQLMGDVGLLTLALLFILSLLSSPRIPKFD